MKRSLKLFALTTSMGLALVACQKDNSVEDVNVQTDIISAVASVQGVAVATTAGGDSIYVVNTCGQHQQRDSIAFRSLPATVLDYLAVNYTGYTAGKSFVVSNAGGTPAGYVVVVYYNDKPVGVKFDAAGAFVKVLEQRDGRDIRGKGFHRGGHFDDRDGMKRDTVALAALPSSITNYMSAQYPSDTLVRAFKNHDSSYMVISINNGAFATVFSASGSFQKHVQLPSRSGKHTSVAADALPAAAATYLSTTYPNHVFKHAFAINSNGSLQGYVVLIDANATKYAVEFDAAGSFVKVRTVR